MGSVKEAGDLIVATVKAYVGAAHASLSHRLDDLAALCAALDQRIAAVPERKDGAPGTSAYQLACLGGFAGTEAQWLDSLRGKDADPIDRAALLAEVVAKIPEPISGKAAEVDYARVGELVTASVAVAVAALPQPRPGKDADPIDLDALAAQVLSKIPAPQPGKDADPEFVREEVARVVAALPEPKAGKDADPVDVPAIIAQIKAGLPAPVPGKDADPDVIRTEVARAVAALPKPKDGNSVTVDDVRQLLEAEAAKWALDFERRAGDILQRAIDRMPLPKNGLDGFNLDDLVIEDDGAGLVTFRFARGELVKSHQIQIPWPEDRGVWKAEPEGGPYRRGNGVTWGGSWFIAQKDDPQGKPGASDDWRLAVKRGRDGDDAKPAPAPSGPVRLQ